MCGDNIVHLKSLGISHADSGPTILVNASHFIPDIPYSYIVLFLELGLNIDTSQLFDEPETVRRMLAEKFRTKTRDEWAAYFRQSDACVTPVLELQEVGDNEHNRERKSFYRNPNRPQCPWEPAPDPAKPLDASPKKLNTREILAELGYSSAHIGKLVKNGVVEDNDQVASKL